MLTLQNITDFSTLQSIRADYFKSSSAPLDGMWHFGFVKSCKHFGFFDKSRLIGYFSLDQHNNLLEFYLKPEIDVEKSALARDFQSEMFKELPAIEGAYVSTSESHFLAVCFDNFPSFKVHTLLYQQLNVPESEPALQPSFDLHLAGTRHIDAMVELAFSSIGADKNWLEGYYQNLIKRQELWFCLHDQQIIAAGECRKFDDFQTRYAELGVLVSPEFQNRGIATQVIKWLVIKSNKAGFKAMCSTEISNIAAQKAISKARLACNNRIIYFSA